MNYVIVFLATILIVVIVYMIMTSLTSSTYISKEIHMKDKPADITASTLTRPDATRYAYNLWIYMDQPISGENTIFDRANDLKLIINGSTSVLSLNLYRRQGNNTTAAPGDTKTYQITNNFPLQKWVFITISVDNATIDMYLDGKLAKSITDTVADNKRHIPDGESPIKFGTITGTYLTKFSRVAAPSDPQTAWNLYMEGSGSKMGLSNIANRYNVNLAILKDNVMANTIPLW
jgi:hypothetical protein